MKSQIRKTQETARSKPVSTRRSSTLQYSHPIVQLQQKYGNQAVQRLLQSGQLQAKLTIGQPNDKYEQEADRVADQVMRMPDSIVQRQTESEEEEEELVQTKSIENKSALVTTELENQIHSFKGGGQPLPASERAFFEPRFGADFGDVRLHADQRAARTAESISARAFTLGRDIVFGAGQYSPGSRSGRSLLAHELTHTLQQRNESTVKRLVRRNISVLNSSQQIQKDPVAVAGLGLAAFSTGKELATSGQLSHKSTPATYMHPGSPASAKWNDVITTLHLRAWNPRFFIGAQHFYFRLAYDYNGYDIRNATINVLRNKSSGMYSSTFDITWSPGKHSRPKDPVAQVVFNISGKWDPVGRGEASFWGKLVISAAQNGKNFESFTIGSEKGYKGTAVRKA